MIIGFNHNVAYRGTGFHVQTEDSGPKNPNLVTLLYHSGTIIASKKTVYADILKVSNLDAVVEDLAKEQHKGMLRSLTHGEFDERILALGIPLDGAVAEQTPSAAEEPAVLVNQPEKAPAPEAEEPVSAPAPVIDPPPVKIVEEPIIDRFRKEKPREMGLEELVYAYLTAGQTVS